MSQSRSERTQKRLSKGNYGFSLQTRLVSFVLLVALVPLIIIAVRDTLQTQQALTKGVEVSLKAGAIQTANSLDNFIQKTLDSLGAESQLADLSNYILISPAARNGTVVRNRTLDLLTDLSRKDSVYIISYALIAENGTVLLDSATDVQRNEAEEAYFSKVRVSDKPIVTAVTYADDKTTSITFASKIAGNNGEYIGILRVKYDSAVLQDVIIKSVGPSADTSVLLLDQLHIRMADTQNPELILKSITPLETIDYLLAVNSRRFLSIPPEEQATNYTKFELALDNIADQNFFTTEISPTTPGDDTIAVAFMQTQPWIVVYSRPTSIFLADIQKQIRANIILVLVTSIIIAIITALISRVLTNPISDLAKTANLITQGNLDARANINTRDEIGLLGSAFNSMADQLQSTLVGLEQRIDERTAVLQKSALELKTIADVAQEIAVIRDMDTLLKVSVGLIRERFNYYHVGIFLVDERGEYAILRAAGSVAAEKLLAENYKLKVGQMGLVGSVTRTGLAYMSLDTNVDANYFDSPLLPETRSEIALPLRSRNITIGALDIQANTPSAFDEKDIQIFQILADQLAAAIENAQLTQQIEGNLAALTIANRMQTQQVWRGTIDQREHPAYEYDGLQVKAALQNLPANLLKQLETGKPITVMAGDGKSKNTLMVPLLVLNQVIGVIGLEQEDLNHVWTNEEIAIAQAAANRAALTLENARLLEESQRRAIKERTIFESTSRIGSALNMENILRATAEELERVLSGSEVVLQFQSGSDQKLEN